MIRLKTLLQYNYFYIILVILVLCLTFIRNSFYNESKFNGSETSFVGIVDEIKKSDDYYKITIKSKEKIIGSYYSKEPLNISLGDKITFKGTLSKPKNNTIPNTFNYRKYLYNHHVYYLVKIDNIKVISKTRSVKYKVKNYIVKRSEKFKHSDYFKAFLIGDKSEMDDYSLFQKNGVSHLFAISGMHLSLLSGIILFLFKKSRFKEILACIFLILFSMITNYSASIYRSLLLFIYIVLNKKLDLRISTVNVLLLVVCTLLIFNPLIIYDMGFLYSVSISLGLILFNKYMKKNYFVNMFLTSFIAFLFSLPITLYYNYEINLMQIINNVVIVPLVSIIIYPLTILTFIFSFLEPILNVLISILKFISTHLIMINIIVPKVSLIFYFTYYVFLFMFLKTNRKIFYQSFGEFARFHPHWHVLVLEGGFTKYDRFIYLPIGADEGVLKVWQAAILALFLRKELIDQARVNMLKDWKHSGFSIESETRLFSEADREALGQYVVRGATCAAKIQYDPASDTVIFRHGNLPTR